MQYTLVNHKPMKSWLYHTPVKRFKKLTTLLLQDSWDQASNLSSYCSKENKKRFILMIELSFTWTPRKISKKKNYFAKQWKIKCSTPACEVRSTLSPILNFLLVAKWAYYCCFRNLGGTFCSRNWPKREKVITLTSPSPSWSWSSGLSSCSCAW